MKAKYRVCKMNANNPNFSTRGSKYYVQLVPKGVITLQRLCQVIAEKTSQNESDLYASIFAVSKESLNWLEEGYRVDWGPMGTFLEVVGSTVPISDPEKVDNAQVYFKGIFYRPESSFRRRLSFTEYQRDYKAETLSGMPEAERLNNIRLLIATEPAISANDCARINRVCRSAAVRDLNTLVDRDEIRRIRRGRISLYIAK